MRFDVGRTTSFLLHLLQHVLLDELTGKVTHLAISTASMETAAHALRSQIQARENEVRRS